MPTHGPIPANIAIIGDYPDRYGDGFAPVAAILHKLGYTSTSCFFTTLVEKSPPEDDIDAWLSERKTCPGVGWEWHKGKWWSPYLWAGVQRVQAQLAEVAPRVVITLGKAPLAALFGQTAIDKWRGSRLAPPEHPFTIVPTIHPRTLKLMPERGFILNMDISRAYNIYTGKQLPRVYDFTIAPDFPTAVEHLSDLLLRANAASPVSPLKLSSDLETRVGHIACHGIADSPTRAICIPHLTISPETPFYWAEEEEAHLVWLYAQLFHHPSILWVGQNYLYDCQYFYRHWGILPKIVRDTMVAHHSLHSNIRKGLDFLSSMYAQDHVYWKDEIKNWVPGIGERQYWEYNCKDACITYEIDDNIVEAAKERK